MLVFNLPTEDETRIQQSDGRLPPTKKHASFPSTDYLYTFIAQRIINDGGSETSSYWITIPREQSNSVDLGLSGKRKQ